MNGGMWLKLYENLKIFGGEMKIFGGGIQV